MSLREKKVVEASPEETREAERAKWLMEQQLAAVRQNEPIKDVFRVTVAVDVVVDSVEAAKATVKELKGSGVFIYGMKGVRRLEALFPTSEAFKSTTELVKRTK